MVLKEAISAAKFGQWTLDLRTEEMICSDQCKANFGRPPEHPFTYQDLHASIHPDDRARVLAQIRTSIEKRTDYHTEYRNVWPDGSIHHVMVRGRADYLPDGTPVTMSGVTLEIADPGEPTRAAAR